MTTSKLSTLAAALAFINSGVSFYITSLQPTMPARVPMTNPSGWTFYAVLYGSATVLYAASGIGALKGKRFAYYLGAAVAVVLVTLFINWLFYPPPFVFNPLRLSSLGLTLITLQSAFAILSVYLIWLSAKKG